MSILPNLQESVNSTQNSQETPFIAGNDAYLGNIPFLRTPPDLEPKKSAVNFDFQIEKFRLQSVARSVLRGHVTPRENLWRVCSCLRAQNGNVTKIIYSPSAGRAHYGGLMVCGSVWVCPVCSVKISARRSEQLVNSIPSSGLTPILVTYTLQHSLADPLKKLWEDLRGAMRHTFNGAARQRFYGRFAIAGYVSAKETRFSMRSGWHPHVHQLLLSELPPGQLDPQEIHSRISGRYGSWLEERGYLVNRRTVDVAVGRGDRDGMLERYLAKWSVELTGQYLKSGQSLSPFQLLSDYAETGDIASRERFVEYAAVTHGSKQLVWSRGLLSRLGVDDLTDEEIVLQQREESYILAYLSRQQWFRVLGAEARAKVLNYATSCGGDIYAFNNWLMANGFILSTDSN